MNQVTNTTAKPRRNDFMKTLVVNAGGEVVSEAEIAAVIGNLSPTKSKLKKTLALGGMSTVNVFLKDQYVDAKHEFYEGLHAKILEERTKLISESFQGTGIPPNKRVQDVLKTILPLYEDQSNTKVRSIFMQVIRVIDATGAATAEFIHKQQKLAAKLTKQNAPAVAMA